MTLTSSITLFLAMLVLAILPGPGILVVVARCLSSGLAHGVSTSVGIVAGDFVFIALALFGLAALSELLGSFFELVKYLGAAYLCWLGYTVVRAENFSAQLEVVQSPSHFASFMAGLLTTLSNPKAILFYVSFFPAFLDLADLTPLEIAAVYAITTLAVGGVMLAYAYLAHKAKSMSRIKQTNAYLRLCAGFLLVGSGLFVVFRG
jgi:threonine/homoserine/homoserine lactone efflux protein